MSTPMAPSTRTLRQPTDRSVPRRRFTMHCQTAMPPEFKVFSIPE
jgi:hypothetical protein